MILDCTMRQRDLRLPEIFTQSFYDEQEHDYSRKKLMGYTSEIFILGY